MKYLEVEVEGAPEKPRPSDEPQAIEQAMSDGESDVTESSDKQQVT